jgi:hypothetical protein
VTAHDPQLGDISLTDKIEIRPPRINVHYEDDYTVSFTASGSPFIDSFEWDFGDVNDPDYGQSVTHTYTENGQYLVTLNLTLDEGPPSISTTYVYIGQGPTYVSGTINNDVVWRLGASPYIVSGLTINEGAVLTIEPGVVIKFANQKGITVNGILDAKGTDDNKIVFTSVLDNTYGGDTDFLARYPDHPDVGDTWQICPDCVGDGRCAWAANYWGQIVFGPTSVNSVIDRAVILWGGSLRSGTWCYNPYATGMVSIQSSSVAMTNSMISNSWGNGIDVSNASLAITGNIVSRNQMRVLVTGNSAGTYHENVVASNSSYGMYYSGTGSINAEDNYWGEASGPLDDSDDRNTGGLYNPTGLGDRVSDYVNYFPWTGTIIGQTATPKGLSGTPGNRVICLDWNTNTEPFLGGYKIYYGTSPGSYGFLEVVDNTTSHKLTGLSNETTYYIAISSMNTLGAESLLSEEIVATPDVFEPLLRGDFDDDCDVDGYNLAEFAFDFGRTDCDLGERCEGDFDADLDVDGTDLAVLGPNFGITECPACE